MIYNTAVAAVVAGSFSLPRAGAQFFIAGAVGIAIGLLADALFSRARTAIHDTRVEGTLSLLIPFLVYLPADLLGASGVLATVTAGLVIGRKSPVTTAPEIRLQIGAIWDLGTFLLNGLVQRGGSLSMVAFPRGHPGGVAVTRAGWDARAEASGNRTDGGGTTGRGGAAPAA